MAKDCSEDLKEHDICFVSLWPGPVKTEYVKDLLQEKIIDGVVSLV